MSETTFTYKLTREQVQNLIANQDIVVRMLGNQIAQGQGDQGGLNAVEQITRRQQATLEMAALLSKPLLEADAAAKKKEAAGAEATPANRAARRAAAATAKKGQ